jgi:hypothetical protein
MKCTFSGHESFQCKSLWLKKGYDFVKNGYTFNDESAVVRLGVGKNMVSSIRYWLKAFGITDEEGKETTAIGDYLFGERGQDPYVEDIATLWILHYLLVSNRIATIYYEMFTGMHQERNEFSKQNIISYLKRQFSDHKYGECPYNENTITKDTETFLKNYVEPSNSKVSDDYSSLLLNIHLIRKIDKDNYEFNIESKAYLDPLIFLFAIKNICGNDVIVDYDEIIKLSMIFCLTKDDIQSIFYALNAFNSNISFENTAGEQLFSIKKNDFTAFEVLDWYYNKKR